MTETENKEVGNPLKKKKSECFPGQLYWHFNISIHILQYKNFAKNPQFNIKIIITELIQKFLKKFILISQIIYRMECKIRKEEWSGFLKCICEKAFYYKIMLRQNC